MEKKVVLVTGGASGIGKACVDYLLECGAKKVYIADLNLINGEKVEQELNNKFGQNRAKFLKCDISNRTEFEEIFQFIYKENPNLDILLNNAGTGENSRVFDVNILGTLNGMELALKYMTEQNENKGGIIINTISILGFTGWDFIPKYVASKHAIVGLTKVYSRPCYFNKTNVKIMGVCPGVTDTDFHGTHEVNALEGVCETFTIQNPKIVAECVGEILKNGENGSFWIVEDEEYYEIEIPCYKTLRKHKV